MRTTKVSCVAALVCLAGLWPAPATAAQTDRTISVKRGARLELRVFAGEVIVKAAEQDVIHVHAVHSSRDALEIDAADGVVRLRSHSERGPGQSMVVELTVPSWLPVNLHGTYLDVFVEGLKAPITVETVAGEVDVKGGSDFVLLKSMQGPVTLEGARGKVQVTTNNEDITLNDIAGDVSVEAVNGEVTLTGIDSSNVEASTVNGDLIFTGTIRDGGAYRFGTHHGDLLIGVPERSNVTVYVRTYQGDFSTDLNGKLTETRPNRRFTFVMGTGGARIDLESYGGDIRVRRPEEVHRPKPVKPPKPPKR